MKTGLDSVLVCNIRLTQQQSCTVLANASSANIYTFGMVSLGAWTCSFDDLKTSLQLPHKHAHQLPVIARAQANTVIINRPVGETRKCQELQALRRATALFTCTAMRCLAAL